MSIIVGAVAISHSPFWDLSIPPPGPGHNFVADVSQLREKVSQLVVDAVVVFGPDHFRNFFYDLMPAFCIGVEEINGFGDFGRRAGLLPGASDLGRALHGKVSNSGFDPAISYRMGIDHGIVQPYELFFPQVDVPLVPIMINANGAPRPSFSRCHEFGRAVGEAIRSLDDDARILLLASGGMSHWVREMSVDHPGLPKEEREYVIGGKGRAAEHSAARDARLLDRARAGVQGRVNEGWDRWVLSLIEDGNPGPLFDLSDAAIEAEGGNGAHELRAWLAVLGAWGNPMSVVTYESIPSWVSGMGCIAGLRS